VRHQHYILIGRRVLAASLMEWARFFERFDRRIAKSKIHGVEVSTVFLGLDHNWSGQGPPIVFETMVFGGELDEEMWRYATYAEAEAGHLAACELVRRAGRKPTAAQRRAVTRAKLAELRTKHDDEVRSLAADAIAKAMYP
jgi:hypothetical protein